MKDSQGSIEPLEQERLLYKPQEAADLLNISKASVYQMVADGDIDAVRVGKAVRISRATLERWIAEREAINAYLVKNGRGWQPSEETP